MQSTNQHEEDGLLDIVVSVNAGRNALRHSGIDVGILTHGIDLRQLFLSTLLLHILLGDILLTDIVRTDQICLGLQTQGPISKRPRKSVTDINRAGQKGHLVCQLTDAQKRETSQCFRRSTRRLFVDLCDVTDVCESVRWILILVTRSPGVAMTETSGTPISVPVKIMKSPGRMRSTKDSRKMTSVVRGKPPGGIYQTQVPSSHTFLTLLTSSLSSCTRILCQSIKVLISFSKVNAFL